MKIKAVSLVALFLSCTIVSTFSSAFATYPYVGLYGNVVGAPGGSDHSLCGVFVPAPYTDVEVWVWFVPDPSKGLSSVDFRLVYPPSTDVVQGLVTSNPLNAVEVGTLTGGINVEVGSTNCQYDWYYTHHQVLTVNSLSSRCVSIAPDTNLTSPPFEIRMTSCELGFPTYGCTVLNDLAINYSCGIECMDPTPGLENVTVEGYTAIRAWLEWTLAYECTSAPYRKHFVLYDKSAPADTIEITRATRDLYNHAARYALTLGDSMVDKTTYILEAHSICVCCGCNDCRNSSVLFTFDKTIATLLQSSSTTLRGSGIEVAWALSAIDEGTSFFVSRSENGGDFKMLDASALSRDGLKFKYVDRSVEPGKSYSYKVEYGVGAPNRVLFISEAISTPAMPLTLYQNKPNPFNPSTTISFYLPQESVVGLEVYDVSGRLVSRLIGGERRSAGTYNVEWNGRDARGAAVSSGVYFYRLTAGKETVSKKMVLLR